MASTLPADVATIQYLRGIAAAMVVWAHANEQFMTGFHRGWRDIGWSGVDLFFVISGFIMTYTVARTDFSRSLFLKKRIARVAPMYWFMTLVAAALVIVKPNLFQTTHFGLSNFLLSLIFVFSRDPVTHAIEPTLHLGWTLNFEMFFYLCFVAVLFLKPAVRTAALTVIFGALIAFVTTSHISFVPVARLADPVVFEFILGCAVGTLYAYGLLRRLSLPISFILTIVGIVALIAGGLANDGLAQRWLFRGVPAALLATGLIAIELKMPLKSTFLHVIGDSTYSIYLTHIFVVEAIKKGWTTFGLSTADLPDYGFVVIATIVAVATGWLAYQWIERRLNRWAQWLLGLRRQQSRANQI